MLRPAWAMSEAGAQACPRGCRLNRPEQVLTSHQSQSPSTSLGQASHFLWCCPPFRRPIARRPRRRIRGVQALGQLRRRASRPHDQSSRLANVRAHAEAHLRAMTPSSRVSTPPSPTELHTTSTAVLQPDNLFRTAAAIETSRRPLGHHRWPPRLDPRVARQAKSGKLRKVSLPNTVSRQGRHCDLN